MSTSIVYSMFTKASQKAVSTQLPKFWFTESFAAKRIAMRRNNTLLIMNLSIPLHI